MHNMCKLLFKVKDEVSLCVNEPYNCNIRFYVMTGGEIGLEFLFFYSLFTFQRMYSCTLSIYLFVTHVPFLVSIFTSVFLFLSLSCFLCFRLFSWSSFIYCMRGTHIVWLAFCVAIKKKLKDNWKIAKSNQDVYFSFFFLFIRNDKYHTHKKKLENNHNFCSFSFTVYDNVSSSTIISTWTFMCIDELKYHFTLKSTLS